MTSSLMIAMLVAAGVAFAAMAVGGRKRPSEATGASAASGFKLALPGFTPRLPYEQRALLSAWERRALLSIRGQVPTGFYVCPQVRLADMLEIGGDDPMGRKVALNKVASKSVDFAVVELATGSVVLVVELDDRSHGRADRRERDAFVNAVLDRAGIPLRRFRPDTPIHIRDFFATARSGAASPR